MPVGPVFSHADVQTSPVGSSSAGCQSSTPQASRLLPDLIAISRL